MEAPTDLRALVERYAAVVDSRDFAALADVFVPDGMLVTPQGERAGLGAITAAIQGLHRYDSTAHVVGASTVDVAGAVATGTVECVAHHYTDGGSTDRVMEITYHDGYVLTDDGWRISSRRLEVHRTYETSVD